MDIGTFAVGVVIYLLLVFWSAVVVTQAIDEMKIRHLVLITLPPVLLLLIVGSLVWDVIEGLGTRLAALVKRGW